MASSSSTNDSPKWSMREKPKMIIGGPVPSWQESIPGPKYSYDVNVVKKREPQYTMRTKPDMVVGGGVPSWTKSIPGPKYSTNTDNFKPRQPVYSMQGRGQAMVDEMAKKGKESAPEIGMEDLKKGMDASRKKAPEVSIKSRTKMIPGAPVPSWVASIPGPKYNTNMDTYKAKTPVYSMGRKLPTESDLMKARSPGPCYNGAAMDAKKQSEVDSTKSRGFSCSFGIGSRWEGQHASMTRQGVFSRFDKPANTALKATASIVANRGMALASTASTMHRTRSSNF
eukprot:TRINITY_DN78448_c0_g1_i1.p1 TRINITY_DN78448_c0_g1~~TRINITY_DN78448_c0_g1_i1.p1  ORF type:complete len:283 (-),score=56.57 TRINITY_DN78448_c0_g1_i1:536-1384(-)